MHVRRIYAEDSAGKLPLAKGVKVDDKKEKALQYTKLSILGEGTYGTVYKARNNTTGQTVAIKKLHLNNVKDGVPTTTLRELSALVHLNGHENIISLKSFQFNIEEDVSKPKLLLELDYCEYDLRTFCKRFTYRRLPLNVIEKIIREITIGTAYCHSNRIIHRDLKPSNILVKFNRDMEETIKDIKRGEWNESWISIKLADFGLARTHYALRAPLTHEVVTLWYRAPEILLGNDSYNAAVDTWSIGCIAAELLYGRPLFTGDTEISTLFKIFQFLGTPNELTWPELVECTEYKTCWPHWQPLKDRWERMRPDLNSPNDKIRSKRIIDFADKALRINPTQRPHVHELACHPLMR